MLLKVNKVSRSPSSTLKQGKEWSLNDARHDKEVTTLDTEITQTTIDIVAAKITFSLVKLQTVNHIEMNLKVPP